MNPYELLGLPRHASPPQVKSAYRKLSKGAHPDAEGGSREAFDALKLAHDTLMDPECRAYFDETGRIKLRQPDNGDADVLSAIGQMLVSMMEQVQGDLAQVDVVALMRKHCTQMVDEGRQANVRLDKQIARAQRMRSRFKKKKDGVDRIGPLVAHHIVQMTELKERNGGTVKLWERVGDFLADYGYEIEVPPPQYQRAFGTSTGTTRGW